MTINISLDTGSIQRAISELQKVKDNIEYGLRQTIEILVQDGAMVAQSAYGGMANASGTMISETTGRIEATGQAAIIAEFGAGDATEVPTAFENMPNTPVYPGSYSESEEGAGMYAALGWWKFGGKVYREIQPREGLLSAKQYIEDRYLGVATGVMKL